MLTLAANIALAGGKVLLLGESSKRAWEDFYHDAVVTFGEAWPSDTAPVLEQVRGLAADRHSCGVELRINVGFQPLVMVSGG